MKIRTIDVKIIPHNEHRYPTVGDWWFKNGVLYVRCSRLSNWRYEACIIVHELVEWFICMHDGVKEKDVDAFDIAFEKARKPGNNDEPGDDNKAPYRKQHCIATGVERILAALLGVSWNDYADEIEALP